MSNFFDFLPVYAAGWLTFLILASVIYRRRKGKVIFRPSFDQPLFLETWRSGYSHRNVLTRLGGASNCLWVAVDEKGLRIAPHFPFTLMFLPEIYGLEFHVSGDAIRSVERQEGLLTNNRVRISVELPTRTEAVFEVVLRDPDAFIRAIEAIRKI